MGTSAVGAAPSPEASCVGKLSEFNTKHPEVFGNRADVAHDLKALADDEAVSPGTCVSRIARRSTPLEECV